MESKAIPINKLEGLLKTCNFGLLFHFLFLDTKILIYAIIEKQYVADEMLGQN